MSTLTGKQRKYLRGLAHDLRPVVHLGKHGLTDALVETLDAALGDHELVKVKFLDFKSEKAEIVEALETRLDCDRAGIVGHMAILFRPARDPSKRRIRLPAAVASP